MADEQLVGIDSLRDLSRTYVQRGSQCRQIGDYLRRQSSSTFWRSRAQQRFQDDMGLYQKTLSDLEMAFQTLAQDLDNRVQALVDSGNV